MAYKVLHGTAPVYIVAPKFRQLQIVRRFAPRREASINLVYEVWIAFVLGRWSICLELLTGLRYIRSANWDIFKIRLKSYLHLSIGTDKYCKALSSFALRYEWRYINRSVNYRRYYYHYTQLYATNKHRTYDHKTVWQAYPLVIMWCPYIRRRCS